MEGCSIGRAFLTAWPTGAYQPTCAEFPDGFGVLRCELDARRASGRRAPGVLRLAWPPAPRSVGVRSGPRCRARRTLCRHLAHVPRRLHGGHVRRPPARWDCGPGGAAQPLFSDLLPPSQPGSQRRRREGIVPDALLERPAPADEARGDGLHRTLHDCKAVLHRCARATSRDRHRGGGEGVARVRGLIAWRGASRLHFHPPPPLGLHRRARRCSPPDVAGVPRGG